MQFILELEHLYCPLGIVFPFGFEMEVFRY
jgi:hypothetical protein